MTICGVCFWSDKRIDGVMAVLRRADTQYYGSEHLAALGLLCGIMCSVLALKFKFNLDFSRGTRLQETPPTVSTGVYKFNSSEQYVGSTSPAINKVISPAMVQLPPPLPPNPPPNQIPNPVVPHPLPAVAVQDNTVSQNPRGGPVNRVKSTDLKVSSQEDKPKLTKKEQKQLEKKEKERIKEQKKKDKKVIAEILKDDSDRIEREAQLLKERLKEKAKEDKTKKPNAKTKDAPKTAETKPLMPKAANPLAQGNPDPPTNTMRSTISNSSGPPPYSGPAPEVTPSETDSSGNVSFAKPTATGGTWDMVSQHREQMKRPVKETVFTKKVENLQYNVGGPPRPSTLEVNQPRKSLYV